MATYYGAKIYKVLCDKLLALTLSPTMQIAFQNVPFTPPTGGYLRASHFPNTTNQITLGDTGINRHEGIFQIDVFTPENEGIIKAMEIAGTIEQHFKRGTYINNDGVLVRIMQPPEITTSLKSSPYLQTPISIRWQADTANSIT
jgi:hypothetical protein